MWEKFKNIHHMFHVAVVFIFFPIAGVISGDYPLLALLWTAIFVGAYYTILLSNHKMFQQISWLILLVYIFYSSVCLSSGFVWYIFYLSNLLVYHFKEVSFKSWRFWSYLTLQPLLLLSLYMKNPIDVNVSHLSFLLVTFLFSNLVTFGLHRIQISEQIKEEKMKQNAQLNLFLAENERNRIGRDLHDSLGHTFAMLSLKTELAQQLLRMKEYEQAGKELAEVNDISKQSMADVRRIIDNLKSRTLHEELITIQTMLEMSDVRVHLDNQLNVASISPSMQSSISMILLELATNIIKHAQAKHCIIYLVSDARNLILDVEDDGIGFKEITGKELHSIRERLTALSGSVEILNRRKPTKIRVVIPIEE